MNPTPPPTPPNKEIAHIIFLLEFIAKFLRYLVILAGISLFLQIISILF